MAGFLYFRSNDPRPIDAKAVADLGLGYILDVGVSIENRQTNANSPSGEKGLVFADPARHPGRVTGVDLEHQTWRELPEVGNRKPGLWVGYWNDAKPTPEDLCRPAMLNGLMIKMADEHQWQVPVVRRFDDQTDRWESVLPAYLDYDKHGNVIRGNPLAQYARLWDLTAPVASKEFDSISQSSDDNTEQVSGPSERDIYAAVVALLQTNYVVDLPELVLMHTLADDQSLALVALTSCRHEKLLEWIEDAQKKSNQQDESGSTTSDGEVV